MRRGGKVTLNTITPTLDEKGSWSGQYYTDYPVTLTAEPADGWVFAGWKTDAGTLEQEDASSVRLAFDGDVTITAVFGRADSANGSAD